ncbi:MAG: PAS domain-containing sensor histidine kinase [Burkholderiales bacterium]
MPPPRRSARLPRTRNAAAGRWQIALAPVLALLAVSALLILWAWSSPAWRSSALLAAVAASAGAAVLAAVRMAGQFRQREAVAGEYQGAQAQLARSESQLSSIVDAAMDAIITVDAAQRIVMFNAAAEAMFHWTRDEALGAPLSELIPERYRGTHGDHVRHFGETNTKSRRMGGLRIVTGRRRDGLEFPIDASISQTRNGDAHLYTVILRDISARIEAEEALRRSKAELQELGAVAHVAREQEKSRVARELHDELGQALTMLKMDVAWCRSHVPDAMPEFAVRLDRMEALLKSTVASTRRIAADLRPLMLDDLGLVPALEWLVENFTQRSGVPCELSIDIGPTDLEKTHSSAVFRIVQESLTNIAKHADAANAVVSVARDDRTLTIRVRDDGAGFVAQDPRKPNSYGLVGLRERAAMLGGQASIETSVGSGTTVEVRLPMEAAAP